MPPLSPIWMYKHLQLCDRNGKVVCMNDMRMIIQSQKAMNWSCRHIYGPGPRKHEALLCCLLQRRKPRLNVGEHFFLLL